jgi:hypothetical protein
MGSEPLIGILMLKTGFPRPPGDIGNPATWRFPVRYEVVETALAGRVVTDRPLPEGLVEDFIEAGERLVAAGAAAITTSCGFLATVQADLAAALPVPVMSSSLLQIPWIQSALPPDRRVGAITIDAGKLTAAHFIGVGAPADTPFVGVERGRELHRVIFADLPELDLAAAEADVLAAGDALRAQVPDLGAVVLECTNMAPYAPALSRHLGLPVHDIVSLVNWLRDGLMPVRGGVA